MFINGICKRDISNIIGRTKETVGKWVNAYFEGGIDALQDNRGGDHASYLTAANKQELKDIITKTYPIVYKGWDGKIIIDLIKTKYGVIYTRNGVYALMKSLGLTHKVASKIDPKKSEEKIATWKEELKKLLNFPVNTILLAQDESRFSSEVTRVTSWSISGSSVVYSGYRYGSLNLKDGNLISSFHDKENFESTIEHFIKVRATYDENIPLAILIDNASWHKTVVVIEYCEQNNIILLFSYILSRLKY